MTAEILPLPPDGGHGWVIVIASCLTYMINGGIFYSQGILYPEFVAAFEAGEASTAWVCSILSGLCLLSGMVTGWFLEMAGYRTLCLIGSLLASVGYIISAFVTNFGLFFLTYSVTIGIGLGLQFVPCVMIIQLYFEKKRALATGITMSGAPLGGFVFVPIAQMFVDSYGWRATLLLIGALALNGCAFSILMVEPKKPKYRDPTPDSTDVKEPKSVKKVKELEPPEPRPLSRLRVDMGSVMMQSIENMRSAISLDLEVDNEETAVIETKLQMYIKKISKIIDFSVLKQGIVLVVLVNNFLFNLGFIVPYVFMPYYTAQYDIEASTTATIISAIGITDFSGRIIFGMLGTCMSIPTVHLYSVSSIVTGSACIILQFFSNILSFYAFALIFGFFVGGWLTTSTVCLAELLGVQNLAKAFAIMQLAGSLAFFTSSPLHALLYEVTSDAGVTFISAGLLQVTAGIMLLLYYHTCYIKQSDRKGSLFKSMDSVDEKNGGPQIVISLPPEIAVKDTECDSMLEIAIVA